MQTKLVMGQVFFKEVRNYLHRDVVMPGQRFCETSSHIIESKIEIPFLKEHVLLIR